ncbi:MAG: PEGA domain-containing protein [Bacteroidetes bacterium]|nr:PEGA domain-containing protein [Bacteroidota bacterium]
MKKFFYNGSVFIFILLVTFLFTSCATLFHGSTDGVNFSSDPSGAKVYVNGDLLGTTPFALNLKSNKTYTLEFKKDGYETKSVLLNSSVGGGWIVLDVLGGLLPIIIDAATGDWYSLDQDHVNAILEQQQNK